MIDWSRIEELRSEIGAEDFDEVVDLFLSEVDGAVESLCAASEDPRLVEEQMHFLKGASLNLGFSALSTLCARGESEAAKGNWAEVPAALVRDCFEVSKTAFRAEYERRYAA